MGNLGLLQCFGKSVDVGVLDNFPLCGASHVRRSALFSTNTGQIVTILITVLTDSFAEVAANAQEGTSLMLAYTVVTDLP